MAQREDQKQALRRWQELELLQKHYAEFTDLVVDVMNGVMGFQCSDIQLDIANYLAKGPKRRMVQAQRGQAKTTITAIYSVWRIIHDPTTRVLVISAGDTQATEIANWIIQIINNMDELECLRADRANGDRASVEAYDIHYTLKGPEKSPSIACIGITANSQGKRADILIADDIESAKNSQTQVQRDRIKHLTLDFTSICSTGDIIYLGTPQSMDSVYNGLPGRGYQIRIWPGRYPTIKEEQEYGDSELAPLIVKRMQANPALRIGGGPIGDRGQATDPVLLPDEELNKKEIDQGAAYFQLQHMLSTHLSDAAKYPLKLSKIRFCNFDREEKSLPMTISHMAVDGTQIKGLEGMPIHKERLHRVHIAENFGPVQYLHMAVDPTGGGANGDELAYAVSGFLAGRVFLFDVGGRPGSIDESSAEWIVSKINKWKPLVVNIERNFGNGAFANILRPLLKDHIPEITEDWEAGQKELRIIDILEPVIGAGKFVMHEELIKEDWEQCQQYPNADRSVYSLLWQMSRISRARDAILHDDRLDAVAATTRHWIELLAADEEKQVAKAKNNAYRKMMENPLGDGRKIPGYNAMTAKFGNKQPTSLSKSGLSGFNPMRRM